MKAFSFAKEQHQTLVACPHCGKNVMPIYNPPKQQSGINSKEDENAGTIFMLIFWAVVVLLLGGIVSVIYFFCFFGTTQGDQVYNIGLLNERECGVLIGIGACITGALLGVWFCIIAVANRLDGIALILTRGNANK